MLIVIGFFAQKWIQTVESAISENALLIKKLSEKFYTFKLSIRSDSQQLSKSVENEGILTRMKTLQKLDKIEQDLNFLQDQVREDVLPELKRNTDQLGRVSVLEERTIQQESNVLKLFEAVQQLVKRFPPQK